MKQIDDVNALTLGLHGNAAAADAFTFQSLAEHVDEVRELLKDNDPHWKAETLDVIIHGYLLLRRHGVKEEEIAALMQGRIVRFSEKIIEATQEKKTKKK